MKCKTCNKITPGVKPTGGLLTCPHCRGCQDMFGKIVEGINYPAPPVPRPLPETKKTLPWAKKEVGPENGDENFFCPNCERPSLVKSDEIYKCEWCGNVYSKNIKGVFLIILSPKTPTKTFFVWWHYWLKQILPEVLFGFFQKYGRQEK